VRAAPCLPLANACSPSSAHQLGGLKYDYVDSFPGIQSEVSPQVMLKPPILFRGFLCDLSVFSKRPIRSHVLLRPRGMRARRADRHYQLTDTPLEEFSVLSVFVQIGERPRPSLVVISCTLSLLNREGTVSDDASAPIRGNPCSPSFSSFYRVLRPFLFD